MQPRTESLVRLEATNVVACEVVEEVAVDVFVLRKHRFDADLLEIACEILRRSQVGNLVGFNPRISEGGEESLSRKRPDVVVWQVPYTLISRSSATCDTRCSS